MKIGCLMTPCEYRKYINNYKKKLRILIYRNEKKF